MYAIPKQIGYIQTIPKKSKIKITVRSLTQALHKPQKLGFQTDRELLGHNVRNEFDYSELIL